MADTVHQRPLDTIRAVRAARLQVAFEGQPPALARAMLLATIALVVLWPSSEPTRALAWYGTFVVITAGRVSLYCRYRQLAATATNECLATLQRRFVLTSCAAGASWGLACVLIFPQAPLLKMFVAFVLAGVSAAAVTTLSSIRSAAIGFVAACTLPLAVRLLAGPATIDLAMSTMIVLFLVTVGSSILRLDAQLLALVRSRMEADEHLQARNAQRDELQAMNERLRLAIQAGKAGIFEWDTATNMITCDEQLYALYDLARGTRAFSYEVWRQRLHPQDLARVELGLDAAIKGRDAFNAEFRVLWADGTERVIKATAIVERNPRGEAVRVIGMNSDITELRRVDRMKSEFVSIVSHELRTPLTSIRAALGLATSGGAGPIGDKVLQLLQLANRNAERLGLLIDDILDIEKIESGKLRFELAPHALAPLLEQAVDFNTAYATTRKVSLRLQAHDTAAIVAIDANRLLQVMTNLLSNAVKFSPVDGTVDITLTTRHGYATVEVHDQGAGIPAEFHERVFTKFCQSDSSDKRAQGGSGLGLAISKALIESMSGRIHFRTSVTNGTSFFLALPLRLGDAPIDDAERTTVVLPVALS